MPGSHYWSLWPRVKTVPLWCVGNVAASVGMVTSWASMPPFDHEATCLRAWSIGDVTGPTMQIQRKTLCIAKFLFVFIFGIIWSFYFSEDSCCCCCCPIRSRDNYWNIELSELDSSILNIEKWHEHMYFKGTYWNMKNGEKWCELSELWKEKWWRMKEMKTNPPQVQKGRIFWIKIRKCQEMNLPVETNVSCKVWLSEWRKMGPVYRSIPPTIWRAFGKRTELPFNNAH